MNNKTIGIVVNPNNKSNFKYDIGVDCYEKDNRNEYSRNRKNDK